ncbi:MAG: hypothetical protein HGA44_17265 [Cellulomonadaceae bacterium]|nr:hypothetical protein [Cellulomonadaceae bacterium]
MQATNLMLMLGRPTRVDKVAEQVERWRALHAVEAADVGPRRQLSRLPWYLWVSHATVLALAVDWYFRAFLPGR